MAFSFANVSAMKNSVKILKQQDIEMGKMDEIDEEIKEARKKGFLIGDGVFLNDSIKSIYFEFFDRKEQDETYKKIA